MFFTISQLASWVIFDFLGRIFFNLKVYGYENLKKVKPGGVVFASNHEGAFDPLLIGGALPWSYLGKMRSFRFVTHFKFITRTWYGFFVWLSGGFAVYPGLKDIKVSTKRAVKILKNRHDVLIFPTGTRKHKFRPEDARQGVAYISKVSNATIIPVFITGIHKITFSDIFFSRRKAMIVFGRPFKLDFDFDYRNKKECLKASRFVMEKVKHLEEAMPQIVARASKKTAERGTLGAKA